MTKNKSAGQRGEPKLKVADVYDIVTKKIISSMENGNIPWRKPWNGSGPKNLFTKKEYRGINNWLLGMEPTTAPFFATFNQVSKAGGRIIKGSVSTPIYFFKMRVYEDENGNKKKFPIAKQYRVFSVDQIEGLDIAELIKGQASVDETEIDELEAAQLIVTDFILREAKTGLKFDHNGQNQAFYRPSTDSIHLPKRNAFKSVADYYSTAFHEMGHATGAAHRLNREGVSKTKAASGHYRGEVYSFEELIAELTASYLCTTVGLDNEIEIGQRAAYIKSWLKVLKDDPKFIWKAAGQAQKATDFILDIKPFEVKDDEGEAVVEDPTTTEE